MPNTLKPLIWAQKHKLLKNVNFGSLVIPAPFLVPWLNQLILVSALQPCHPAHISENSWLGVQARAGAADLLQIMLIAPVTTVVTRLY